MFNEEMKMKSTYLKSLKERKEKIYVITCFSDKDKFLGRVSVD